MKTLMKRGGIGVVVAQLDGYLQAVRDMNDDHSGKRHWYWADMVSIKNEPVSIVINRYLKYSDLAITEIDLRQELEIIESQILENYLQGSFDINDDKQRYIMGLHGWRIQEFLALAANYKDADGRWTTEFDHEEGRVTSVFVKIKSRLIALNFMKSI